MHTLLQTVLLRSVPSSSWLLEILFHYIVPMRFFLESHGSDIVWGAMEVEWGGSLSLSFSLVRMRALSRARTLSFARTLSLYFARPLSFYFHSYSYSLSL